jgi:hypothetical protein
MRLLSPSLAAVGLSALLILPSSAAAQNTLTGRLVEAIPGGGAIGIGGMAVYRVLADGQPVYMQNVTTCSGGNTTNCILPGGEFTLTDLPNDTYLFKFDSTALLKKNFNAVVAGNTNIGDVPLIRRPFSIDVTVGDIPASGGPIPVSLRATRLWNIPTLPLLARITIVQDSGDGRVSPLSPQIIPFTWPAPLADTGQVPIAPLEVPADYPAGGEHCVFVEFLLEGNPPLVLAGSGDHPCSTKRP